MQDFTTDPQTTPQQVQLGTSDEQHIADLVRFCKGWHKFAPFVGACLLESLSDERAGSELYGRVRQEIENDGAELRRLALAPGPDNDYQLQIEANYA